MHAVYEEHITYINFHSNIKNFTPLLFQVSSSLYKYDGGGSEKTRTFLLSDLFSSRWKEDTEFSQSFQALRDKGMLMS